MRGDIMARIFFQVAVLGLFVLNVGRAGAQETEAPPVVGRGAAAKYMQASDAGASRDHYLALHLGSFISSAGYEWSQKGKIKDPGLSTFGITYRVGEWVNTMDLLFRVDFTTYDLVSDHPLKMSVIPIIAFPDSASRFPLYFGAGVGPGVFFRQAQGSPVVSLDYQFLAGLRFFNLHKTAGFFAETGLKNHVHLGSGQFNGFFFSVGGLFAF
jgi:hypothetical protein